MRSRRYSYKIVSIGHYIRAPDVAHWNVQKREIRLETFRRTPFDVQNELRVEGQTPGDKVEPTAQPYEVTVSRCPS